jgi:hypothetical protein
MAQVHSNGDEIAAWLDAVVAGFDFTLPGIDQSLGRDLARTAAQGMIDRAVDEGKDPDGAPLKPNAEPYRSWKRKKYSVEAPLVRTGQMLSLESMMGETSVSADRIDMVYGTGEAPTRGSTGYISESDKKVTDRQKAAYVTDGGRRFYEFDRQIASAIVAQAGEAFGRYLEDEIG